MPNVNMGRVRIVWEIPSEPDLISIMPAQDAILRMGPLINNLQSGETLTIQPA